MSNKWFSGKEDLIVLIASMYIIKNNKYMIYFNSRTPILGWVVKPSTIS